MSQQNEPTPAAEVTKLQIAEFYNDFSTRLVDGFIQGNPRLTHALDFATAHVPQEAEKLLEIGCGVGETTSRLCAGRPSLQAVGVDISPQNVHTAQQLFATSEQFQFAVSDLTSPVVGGPFDVVTLLDVYEHIPAAERKQFHANLRQSMSDRSRLILTCPSYLHQNYLREHQPSGLQIVDETIGPREFLQLADDLGGHLVHLQYESVWRTNDYIYAVIDTQMQYQWKPKVRGLDRLSSKFNKLIDKTPLGGPARRARFVKRRLAA
ncbi:class I SAM-dependent methyltransferase [Stieleria varia]|uniref:Mg-protoporphyrin IX methyl transferase n=1 Tax=Stieleria varia TaxID=2528005 RepID=A0A5C6B6C6_9BACT|nr:class I SAM-dependent methyltransferase [Stieleria varia]TWU07613.1 Mg-protoporphyrin IX methyl transferase [Stieleria varia]